MTCPALVLHWPELSRRLRIVSASLMQEAMRSCVSLAFRLNLHIRSGSQHNYTKSVIVRECQVGMTEMLFRVTWMHGMWDHRPCLNRQTSDT